MFKFYKFRYITYSKLTFYLRKIFFWINIANIIE